MGFFTRLVSMETYLIQFNPDQTKGVYGISLVADPAIEAFFVEMNKDYDVQLKVVDEEKRLFMTPVLIPGQKVLRLSKDGTPFNIVFPKEVIQSAQQNFQKNGFQNNSNLEHDISVKLNGVTFVETWIKKDDLHDQSLIKGFKQPIGTWFTIFRVDDDEVLAKIKSGEIKGVSIDGAFEIDENFKLNTNMNIETILGAIKDGFKSLNVKMASEITTDGTEVYFEGQIEEGTAMFTDAEMTQALPNETYSFEKIEVTIADGKVTEVKEVAEAEAEAEVALSNADEVLAKVMELLSSYSVEMAKEVSKQLATFKAEMKKDVVKPAVVQLTAPKPNHEVKEPKNLKEKLLMHMQNAN
jgi:hypothetical protein